MKKRAIFTLVAVINLICVVVVILGLPQTVATHYGLSGEADRMGSRWMYLFVGIAPLIIMVGYAIYAHATRDSAELQRNRALEDFLVPVIALLIGVIGWITLLMARAGNLAIEQYQPLIFVVVGFVMLVISNYMGKLSRNRYLGYKLPWTLKDDVVWNRTHRLAGYVGTAGGLVAIAAGLLGFLSGAATASLVVFLVGLLIAVVPPIVYARHLYNSRHNLR